MELKDTAELMCSVDYKNRFRAEYWQVKIRLEKLEKMLEMWDKSKLTHAPGCARETYLAQKKSMETYIEVLETRAAIEAIDLAVGQSDDDVLSKMFHSVGKDKALRWLVTSCTSAASASLALLTGAVSEKTVKVELGDLFVAMSIVLEGMGSRKEVEQSAMQALKAAMMILDVK
jgi:hypothetical protein